MAVGECYLALPNPDPNFVTDFQTNNFASRLFELYLLARFREQGIRVRQDHPSPDFEIDGAAPERARLAQVSRLPTTPSPFLLQDQPMKRALLAATLLCGLTACGPRQPAASAPTEAPNDAPTGPARLLSAADKAKYDIDGALLGMSYAEIASIWRKRHPGYKIELTKGRGPGGRNYIQAIRLATASGDDAFEASFSGPISGNRAFYLKHSMENMGTPIDRKAVMNAIMAKLGGKTVDAGVNHYGGEIVGSDGKLIDACRNFKFSTRMNETADKNDPDCGLAALATVVGDTDALADAATLQIIDFRLLAQLEQEEAAGEKKAADADAAAALPHARKPSSF
jgi:hypothetical protein